MEHGICMLPVVPLRAEPSDRSEMVSQVLFGETVVTLEEHPKWVRVRCHYDDYEGWIDRRQVVRISYEDLQMLLDAILHITLDPFSSVRCRELEHGILIPAGSSLPGLNGKQVVLNGQLYKFDGHASQFSFKGSAGIAATAMLFHGCPYLWGGRTHFGIDCSGLTQIVAKMNGIRLPRDASQQAAEGQIINFQEEALPGDLAFFEDAEGKIIHTGILLDKGRIIHASGRVRIDMLDHQGIFNQDRRQYTHSLRTLRRITPAIV